MMRNKYSRHFETRMVELAPTYTLDELLKVATRNYHYKITKTQLRQYLYKRNIIYKDYNINKKRDMGSKLPIFSERVKTDGMTQIKISKNKWEYKQRYLYEKYHNVELKTDEYVIFLDQNKTNFDINNLKVISRQESALMSNQGLFSKNAKVTELGIANAKLINKIKERGKIYEKHNKNK